MNWITKEIVSKKIFAPPVKATEVFQSIADTHKYLLKVLGEPIVEVKTNFLEIIEDGHCPNKCKSARVHLRTQYESTDSNRRVREVQCLYCGENYLLFQTLDGE